MKKQTNFLHVAGVASMFILALTMLHSAGGALIALTADDAQPAEVVIETPEQPRGSTIVFDDATIDYYQWVIEQANSDAPLGSYSDPHVRKDIEWTRNNMTQQERAEFWFGLESMRGQDIGIEYEVGPRNNRADFGV